MASGMLHDLSAMSTTPTNETSSTGDRARRAPSPRARRVVALLVAVLRALALVGAINVAGVLHTARDAVAVVASGELPADDRGDAGEESCPDGCPTCHGAHAPPFAGAPARGERVAATSPADGDPSPRPSQETAPAGPSRATPFRPPRVTTATA